MLKKFKIGGRRTFIRWRKVYGKWVWMIKIKGLEFGSDSSGR